MRRAIASVALAIFLAAQASALLAHDFWIEPTTFHPAPGEEVGVRLRVGEVLVGDAVPRLGRQIVRFDAVAEAAAGASTAVARADGAEPAGRWQPRAAGPYTLVYVSSGAYAELAAERFADYLVEEGLDGALAETRRRGEDEVPARERYTRHAKALVAVGAPQASREAFTRPFGLELELVPDENPLRLAPGASLAVRLLARGKPLAGAQLVGRAGARPGAAQIARTDAQGRATLHLDCGGLWLVKAVHMVRAADNPLAEWHSAWASLTFSLPER